MRGRRAFLLSLVLIVVGSFLVSPFLSSAVLASWNHSLYFSVDYSDSSAADDLSRTIALNESTVITLYDESTVFYYRVGHFDGMSITWHEPHNLFTDATRLATGKSYLKSSPVSDGNVNILYAYTSDNGTDDRFGLIKLTFTPLVNGSYLIEHGSKYYIKGITNAWDFSAVNGNEMQIMMVPSSDSAILVWSQFYGTSPYCRFHYFGIEWLNNELSAPYKYQVDAGAGTYFTTSCVLPKTASVMFIYSLYNYQELSYDNGNNKILWLHNGTFSTTQMRNFECFYVDTGTGVSVVIMGVTSNHFAMVQLFRADGGQWDCTPYWDLTARVLSGVHAETDGTPAATYSNDVDSVILMRELYWPGYGSHDLYIFLRLNGDTDWDYMQYDMRYYNFTVSEFGSLIDPGNLYLSPRTNQEADQNGGYLSSVVGFIETYPSSNPSFKLWNYIYDFEDEVPSYSISFYGNPLNVDINETVTFYYSGDVIPGLSTYNWSFGDGTYFETTLSDYDPTHSYSSSGWYSVNLTVDSTFGTYYQGRSSYILVNGPSDDVPVGTDKLIDGIIGLIIIFLPGILVGQKLGKLGFMVVTLLLTVSFSFFMPNYWIIGASAVMGAVIMFYRGGD